MNNINSLIILITFNIINNYLYNDFITNNMTDIIILLIMLIIIITHYYYYYVYEYELISNGLYGISLLVDYLCYLLHFINYVSSCIIHYGSIYIHLLSLLSIT